MLKKILVAACLIHISSTSYSQTSIPHELYGRFNFLGLLDFLDDNINFGAEYKFTPRWSAGADVAYVYASKYFLNANSAKGFIARPFVRYYLDEKSTLFLQGEFQYKRVAYKIKDWIGRLPVNGVPAYEEYTTFNYIKSITGANFRFGSVFDLSPNERLKMELTIGLGYRVKKEHAADGVYTPGRVFFIRNVNNQRMQETSGASLPLNITLTYKIK